MLMYKPSIYSASKIWHATKWQRLRDVDNFRIIASWIDLPCGTPEKPTGAKLLTPAEKAELWQNCKYEPAKADMTILYSEETDEQRGGLVEIGAALGSGKAVYAIGECKTLRHCEHSDVAFTYDKRFHWVPTFDWESGYYWAVDHYLRNYQYNYLYSKAA